jgi:hypothetical protein
VQAKSTTLFGERKVIFKETDRAVTPFGGLWVFFEHLKLTGFREEADKNMPFTLTSPNAIRPVETLTCFLTSVLAGARRFSHTAVVRSDDALHAMMGVERFPGDDSFRNFFRRFNIGEVSRFFHPMWEWMISRLPDVEYSLDMDSTVFERYGKQEGSKKGFNPRKPGRASHHPLLAVLAERCFVLHGWLRSGNTGSSSNAVEFLKEALSLAKNIRIRCVRADSGFFYDEMLSFLESRGLRYIIVARMTRHVKNFICWRIRDWKQIDENYSVGEIMFKLPTWTKERRFVVIRERIREDKEAVGKKLIDVPGYTFRVLVTNMECEALEVWHDYNMRADVENRIEELKNDLAADSFCMKWFYSTEAVFRSILMLFNLLSEFQHDAGIHPYKEPATLRTQVFLCGAILGRAGHNLVIHMSKSWGGIGKRIQLVDSMLRHFIPTSPKLGTEVQNPTGFLWKKTVAFTT